MKKVMVVGEESEARAQVVSTLANEAYVVEAAGSGEEAWNKLRLAPDSYKLVVSCFVLPGISGIELVTRIQDMPLLDRIPIVLLESAGRKIQDGDLMLAYKAGADICLTAPMHPEELIAFSRRFIKDSDMPSRYVEPPVK